MSTVSRAASPQAAPAENQPTLSEAQILGLELELSRLITTQTIADQRFGFILSADIAMLGALSAAVASSTMFAKGPAAWLLVLLAAGFLVGSLAAVVAGAYPRMKAKRSPSVIFFKGIASVTPDEYFRHLQAVSRTDYARELADNCHRMSQIVAIKFRCAQTAIVLLLFGAGPWAGSLYVAGRLPVG
jgi:hypothetical protein